MKRNLLFVTIVSVPLIFFNFNANAVNGAFEGGLIGIIAGKVYDAIFGEIKHEDSDNRKDEYNGKKEKNDDVNINNDYIEKK